MVEEIEGVVKLVPVPRLEPPVEAAYQSKVAEPFEAVAPSVTVPLPQRLAGVVVETVAVVDMVAVTAVLLNELQPAFVAWA